MAQSFDDDKTISATEINQNLVMNLLVSLMYKRYSVPECGVECVQAVCSLFFRLSSKMAVFCYTES